MRFDTLINNGSVVTFNRNEVLTMYVERYRFYEQTSKEEVEFD